MFSTSVIEKNAIPIDIPKRGVITGANSIFVCRPSRSHTECFGSAFAACCAASLVAARMLCTRFRGGATSSISSSHASPLEASANNVLHAPHSALCASKRSRRSPFRAPSSASVSRTSNSAQCIPDLVSPNISNHLPRPNPIGLQGLSIRTLQQPR